ncbi:hypothetical protein [Alicyclobacillus sp. ALC3]|uniref:hypothetical protein n=1 Tax=Alicyclobacillus sp. ALC3 TaxID=2796143 RepID=UPI002379C4DE|nr:hypothetical protein [Alicyclobacillus sp. ALC3]WDL98607.1 hypothetical protein JC200_08050 [Alicyclobacillus sp. ALC3]
MEHQHRHAALDDTAPNCGRVWLSAVANAARLSPVLTALRMRRAARRPALTVTLRID